MPVVPAAMAARAGCMKKSGGANVPVATRESSVNMVR